MMKVRLSITLSDDLVTEIDRMAADTSRSAAMERLLRQAIRMQNRELAERDESARLDRFAAWLAHEDDDLLDYQADPFA